MLREIKKQQISVKISVMIKKEGSPLWRAQLVKKLFWDAEGGVPYKIIYED